MRTRYRFEQFKKLNPEKFDTLVNRIIADLSELEKAAAPNMVSKKEALNNHGNN